MSHFPKAAALTLITSLGACSSHHDAPADRQKLMQTSREWSRAAAAGHVDAIVDYWAEDAAVMMPGLPLSGEAGDPSLCRAEPENPRVSYQLGAA